ncbi:hypothetical protein [Nocardia asiatica]|uniref:hypothetical protein n=1 Tax=Nocardia asiatica TaxID=209252 RepID=UPI0002FE2E79|nr:hypothetical protein [Nocardia asiatica]
MIESQQVVLRAPRWQSVAAVYGFVAPDEWFDDTAQAREAPAFVSYNDPDHPDDGLVGVGRQATDFARAKDSADERQWWKHDSLLIDAIHGRYALDGVALSTPPAELQDILLRDGVRRLAVVAHGDGGHLNLGELVVCGLYTDVERDLDAKSDLEFGCRAGVRCKRASGSVTVILCHQVRACEVVIVSCKAGTLVEPAYRTTTNVVVGLADGYPRAIVAPIGNAQVSAAVTEGLSALLSTAPLGALRSYLDDVSGRGTARFRIVGTRASAGEQPAVAASDSVVVHRLSDEMRQARWEELTAVRRGPQVRVAPGITAVYGGRHMVLPLGVSPSDFTLVERWSPNPDILAHHQAILDRVRLTRTQLDLALRAQPPEAGAHEIRKELNEISTAYEANTWSSMRNLSMGSEHGLGSEPSPAGQKGDLLDRWAGSVGRAFASIPSIDPCRVATSGLWVNSSEVIDELCELCGSALRVSTLADALSATAFRRYDCPHCACRRLEPQGLSPGRIHVSFEQANDGGHGLLVSFETARGESAHVVWTTDFKGAQSRQQSQQTVLESSALLPITVPAQVTDQLHTVRVVAIVGAHIWTWRTRMKVR